MEERSSPSRVLGCVVRTVTLGDKTITLSQADRIRKAADEESVIISRRLDILPALVQACEKLPESSRDKWMSAALDKLMCGLANPDEWRSYYRSNWRTAFRLWNAMDPKEKLDESGKRERSLLDGVNWAFELIMSDDRTKEELEAMDRAIVMVSQEKEIENLSGCPAE